MSSSLSALSRQLSNTSSQPQSSSHTTTTPPLNPSSLLLHQQTQQQQHNNVNNYIHQPYHHHQLESIPNQIGYAILQQSSNSNNGNGSGSGSTMIQQPTGKLSIHDVNILYKMLIEIGDLLYTSFEKKQQQKKKKMNVSDGDGIGGSTSEVLKRFNVEMNSISYSVCVTVDGYIYIVMKESKKFQSTTL